MSNKNTKGSQPKLIKHGANIPKLQPVTVIEIPVSGNITEKGAPIPTMQPVSQTTTDSSGSGQGSQGGQDGNNNK